MRWTQAEYEQYLRRESEAYHERVKRHLRANSASGASEATQEVTLPTLRPYAVSHNGQEAREVVVPKGGQVCLPNASMTAKPSTDIEKLNKTERAYYDYLRGLGADWIGVQNITLKLADDTRLTCDFNVIDRGEMRCIDVKGGFWREDAKIKIKIAARLFPWATFIVAQKDKGAWKHIQIKP